MIYNTLPELFGVSFTFRDRGTVIPGDRRPAWRIALIACLLKYCSRGQKSSLVRLHILDWAMRNNEGRDQLFAYLEDEVLLRYACVRYDPALLRAVLIGEAERLFEIENKNVRLLPAGVILVTDVEKSKTLSKELGFMSILGKQFTEGKTDRFLKSGGGL